MAYNFTNVDAFRTGGTDQMYTLATGDVATALDAQGFKQPITHRGGSPTFTNGSPTVNWSFVSSGYVGKIVVNRDDLVPYRIVSFVGSTSFDLDRDFEGTSGTHQVLVFTGPSSGVPSLNPQKNVLGVDP